MTTQKATIQFDGRSVEIHPNTTVGKAIKILKLNSNSYLAIRDGDLITEDVVIQPGDTIRLIKVISGG
jgi:sulfur carrier protein ThiS